MQTWMSQVRKGANELWVMAALEKSESYGYEIFQQLTGSVGQGMSEGTIYPMLSRLTRKGWMTVRAGSSPAGPQRRYYRLTAKGAAELKKMKADWTLLQRQSEAFLHRD